MCLYPTIIQNKRYTPTIKNGGIIPPFIDSRVLHVPYGCGNCMECRKQKSREWAVRLYEDIKQHTNGKMVTLTLSDESYTKLAKGTSLTGYDLDNYIATKAVHYFRERWRKHHKHSPRHWLVTELGHEGTENIHLHGIIWTNKDFAEIKNQWQYGFIYPRYKWQEARNYVSNRTINYCVKYIHKMDKIHQKYKPIVLCSPGIGQGFIKKATHKIKCIDEFTYRNKKGVWSLRKCVTKCKTYYIQNPSTNRNKFKGADTTSTYKTSTGHEIALTMYWRNQLYNDNQREQLWINQLDKQERWICGEKVDISKGEEEYYKLLEYYQRKNIELGYRSGKNDKTEWNRKVYEEERRKLIQVKRFDRNNKKNNNKDEQP